MRITITDDKGRSLVYDSNEKDSSIDGLDIPSDMNFELDSVREFIQDKVLQMIDYMTFDEFYDLWKQHKRN